MKKYTLNGAIDLPLLRKEAPNQEKDDKCYFKCLFEAILKVPKTYVTFEASIPCLHDGSQAHLERTFAYEFYRQWANQLEEKEIDLDLNGEVYKRFDWGAICYDVEGGDKKEKGAYPDLVLHASQGNDNYQKMICEIKRTNFSKSEAFADFLKLSCYLSEGSFYGCKPFDYGIFILIGDPVNSEEIKICDDTKVKWDKNETANDFTFKAFKEHPQLKATFSRIVCITYNGNKESLEYDTLENII